MKRALGENKRMSVRILESRVKPKTSNWKSVNSAGEQSRQAIKVAV